MKDIPPFDEQLRLVRTLASEVDASAVFASYSLSRMLGGKQYKHCRPTPVAIELAAWALFPEFGKSQDKTGEKIQKVIDELLVLENSLSRHEFVKDLDAGEDYGFEHQVRRFVSIVRGTAYPVQTYRRLTELFQPFEERLNREIGIGPLRSASLMRSILDVTSSNLSSMQDRMQNARTLCDGYSKKANSLSGPELVEWGEAQNEVLTLLNGMAGEWVPSWEQVSKLDASYSKCDWEALHSLFGLSKSTLSSVDSVVAVQDRPAYFLDDEHSFVGHISGSLDAVFWKFDDALRSNSALQDEYGKHIAAWMENEIQKCAERIFPRSSIFRSALFEDPDRVKAEVEADVLVRWGPFLVVFEAKGKRVPQEALRGDKQKLRTTIRKNVQDSFFQSRRVYRALETSKVVTFREKGSGRSFAVSKDEVSRVFSVSVTLQPLANITAQLSDVRELGLLKHDVFPWAVSIDDIDVVSRFAGYPDVFLHYIERRIEQQGMGTKLIGDELDIYSHYLDTRLHPTNYQEHSSFEKGYENRAIYISGGEERFEPFYVSDWTGSPTPKSKVALDVPEHIHEILRGLRQFDDHGARWIAFALLGLSNSSLEKLNDDIQDLLETDTEPGRIQRKTFKEGDVVVNILSHAGLDGVRFRENVLFRARLEHYRFKSKASVALGIDRRTPFLTLDCATWIQGKAEFDPELEEMLSWDRSRKKKVTLFNGSKKPGRNDPCPCGSGKKFKKCCIDLLHFG